MPSFYRNVSRLASAALLPLLALGCSQTAMRGKTSASAPTLGEGRTPIHGVSDPNAPFTLVDRTKTTATQPFTGAENAADSCSAANLQIYEAAASMDGDKRIVRLAFKNRGTAACRMSGFPAIQLQDDKGVPVASIAIRQTSESSLSGAVAAPAQEAAGKQPLDIVIRPASEASFEIGWTSGSECPLVSRFTVSIPAKPAAAGETTAFSGVFTISHPLNVCNGELRVTALIANGTA